MLYHHRTSITKPSRFPTEHMRSVALRSKDGSGFRLGPRCLSVAGRCFCARHSPRGKRSRHHPMKTLRFAATATLAALTAACGTTTAPEDRLDLTGTYRATYAPESVHGLRIHVDVWTLELRQDGDALEGELVREVLFPEDDAYRLEGAFMDDVSGEGEVYQDGERVISWRFWWDADLGVLIVNTFGIYLEFQRVDAP